MSNSTIAGIVFWLGLIGFFALIRPGARIHRVLCDGLKRKHRILICAAALLLIAAMAWLMSLPINWNGDIPGHRDQYEQITESFLKGHLYFDYNVDPGLLEMENPYDRAARDAMGVSCYWDHAFYNGHYYMYFGVVPVFLLFLPCRLITGTALTTYHATQIFAAGFTLGLFSLFWNLTKKFFKNLPLSVYLSLSLILSLASLKYSVKYPALYHTAISAGLCLEIWSLFFFTKAVWFAGREKKTLLEAALGALLGALAFGCRPSLALGNIALIPLIIVFLKDRPASAGLLSRIVCVVLPYVLVAAALMAYNQARFDNPFEFGQTYQLTSVDQSGYGNMFSQLDFVRVINGLIFSLAKSPMVSRELPWISHGGVWWECPALILGFAWLFDRETNRKIGEKKLKGFLAAMAAAAVLIIVVQTAWSPWLLERYGEDFIWLLAVGVFVVVGVWYTGSAESARFAGVICWVSFASFLITCLLILIPENYSFTMDDPKILWRIEYILRLGIPAA